MVINTNPSLVLFTEALRASRDRNPLEAETHTVMGISTYDLMFPDATINIPFLSGTNIITCTIPECLPALWHRRLWTGPKDKGGWTQSLASGRSPKFMEPLVLNLRFM